jgi:hypothetical protein
MNATKRPSAEMEGAPLTPETWAPAEVTLTRSVVFAPRSWTKTSQPKFVSPGTRLPESLMNAA